MPNIAFQGFLKKYITNYTCKHINPPILGKMKPRGDYVYTIKYIIWCFVAYISPIPRKLLSIIIVFYLGWHGLARTSATARCLQIHQIQHIFLRRTCWFHINVNFYAISTRKEPKMHRNRPHWSLKRTSNVAEKSSKKLPAEPTVKIHVTEWMLKKNEEKGVTHLN